MEINEWLELSNYSPLKLLLLSICLGLTALILIIFLAILIKKKAVTDERKLTLYKLISYGAVFLVAVSLIYSIWGGINNIVTPTKFKEKLESYLGGEMVTTLTQEDINHFLKGDQPLLIEMVETKKVLKDETEPSTEVSETSNTDPSDTFTSESNTSEAQPTQENTESTAPDNTGSANADGASDPNTTESTSTSDNSWGHPNSYIRPKTPEEKAAEEAMYETVVTKHTYLIVNNNGYVEVYVQNYENYFQKKTY